MSRAALTASDWRRLMAAWGAQILTACALRTVSMPTVQRMAARLRWCVRPALGGPEPRVVWAIEASGRRLPGLSTCLVRALVAECALGSPARPLRLMIGVRRAPGGGLLSHAWVVDEADADRVLIGGSMAEEYVPLEPRDRIAI